MRPVAFAYLLSLLFLFPRTNSAVAQVSAEKSWRFAVSGDSRNCGDVVMPAIAASVLQKKVEFYWHLGDFRAMYGVDEDMQARYKGSLPYKEYLRIAWGDFLSNQVALFGTVPVHLGIGNHEVAGGKTLDDFLLQFGYWMDSPEIRAQRTPEDIQNGKLTAYYHWKQHNIDFIYLDNSSNDGFVDPDDANSGKQHQIEWFEQVLAADKADANVRTVIVGMHRALSNSLACGHSMNGDVGNESKQSLDGGRRVYEDLMKWRHDSNKFVYVLASHSHFYMDGIFETPYWEHRKIGKDVLPGWIVGTAGAIRYNLPRYPEDFLKKHHAQTDVAGYLLASVKDDGEVRFDFKEVNQSDLPQSIQDVYGSEFVGKCFKDNHDSKDHPPPATCNEE